MQVKMKELLSGGSSKGAFLVFLSAANSNLFWQRESECSLTSEVVYNH